MTKLIIDPEFQMLLPVLDRQTFAMLEANILENGVRDPIVTWNNIIIDGHNRYEIATKHKIPFKTAAKEFNSRDDVLIWIVSTQIARRNLAPLQLSLFRGMHYLADKRIQGSSNQHSVESENRHSDGLSRSTAKRLASEYNVSCRTIERDAKVAQAINAIGLTSPEARRNILSGSTRVSKKRLRELLTETDNDLADVAASIENGTFLSKAADAPANGTEALGADHAGNGSSNMLPLEIAFNSITDDFSSKLRKNLKKNNTAALKVALTAYISQLDELFMCMG